MFTVPATKRVHEFAQILELAEMQDLEITQEFFMQIFDKMFGNDNDDIGRFGGMIDIENILGKIGKIKNPSRPKNVRDMEKQDPRDEKYAECQCGTVSVKGPQGTN